MTAHLSPSASLLTTLWERLSAQAQKLALSEPALTPFFATSLTKTTSFSEALAGLLARELADEALGVAALQKLIQECYKSHPSILDAALCDLQAVMERDPATRAEIEPFLFFKGYHALQAYRVAHSFWHDGRPTLALYLQGRIARCFAVDIHPAAKLGRGIMFDHANGIVIGETAVVEDNVSFLHSVTLGGTGKDKGDRHPKIRSGVMIGAGAKVLGNIEVGACARVAAGSVVLEDVPANATVAGVPARIIGVASCGEPALDMDQMVKAQK